MRTILELTWFFLSLAMSIAFGLWLWSSLQDEESNQQITCPHCGQDIKEVK